MYKWKKRTMCTNCNKTFDIYSLIEVCPRCGTILHAPIKRNYFLGDKLSTTDKFVECVAKRTLLGWKVKKDET